MYFNIMYGFVFKFKPFIHRNLRRRFGDSIQVLDVGWAFEPWKPKMLPPGVSRHCRIVPPEAWEVSKLQIEDDFLILKKCWVFLFCLGSLDVENFQAANLSWRTTRGQMASLLVDVFKMHC